MQHVWDLVDVECIACESTSRWSIAMSLAAVRDIDRPRCRECSARPVTDWHVQIFAAHGLVRDHAGSAKVTERVEAHCADPECGAWREISVSALMSDETPCLNCAERRDPDARHVVYLIHFPGLGVYKIGITNPESRNDRIDAHLMRGGVFVESHEVPNRLAALVVERHVMDLMRAYPSYLSAKDFPQGGHTETWSDDASGIDLAGLVERLASAEAPGFDRLRKLREYFADEPATIEELVRFRKVDVVHIDGLQVHCVGFSEPEEHVLRKIKARRESTR